MDIQIYSESHCNRRYAWENIAKHVFFASCTTALIQNFPSRNVPLFRTKTLVFKIAK